MPPTNVLLPPPGEVMWRQRVSPSSLYPLQNIESRSTTTPSPGSSRRRKAIWPGAVFTTITPPVASESHVFARTCHSFCRMKRLGIPFASKKNAERRYGPPMTSASSIRSTGRPQISTGVLQLRSVMPANTTQGCCCVDSRSEKAKPALFAAGSCIASTTRRCDKKLRVFLAWQVGQSNATIRAVLSRASELRINVIVFNDSCSTDHAPKAAPLSDSSLHVFRNFTTEAILVMRAHGTDVELGDRSRLGPEVEE